jgi:sulfite exporter TauE/SafE/copper chaperone CopZ
MPKQIIKISGLHCKACEILSEEKLSALPGIKAVNVSHRRGQAEIDYEGIEPNKEIIKRELQSLGYDLEGDTKAKQTDKNKWRDLVIALVAAIIVSLALNYGVWPQNSEGFNANTLSWGGIWIIGLIAGLSTCMALVGGIVLALATDYAKRHPEASRARKFLPHLYFNIGRVAGFFLFGGLLGGLGSILKISSVASAWLTLFIGIFIILLGLQIIDVFPILRKFSFSLPKHIAKIIPGHNKNKRFHPAGAIAAGALSFFLPCGFTQSIQLYALSSGNFLSGGITMAVFAIGTSIGLIGLGGLVAMIKGKNYSLFLKISGAIIIIFGLFNFNNAYKVLLLHTESQAINKTTSSQVSEVQIIKMTQNNSGYSPNNFQIEANRPVRWIINSTSPYSCASSLIVPSLKINQQLKKGENIIEFMAPANGKIKFSCSMGMYNGVINIISEKEKGSSEDASNTDLRSTTEENKLPVCNINGCK